MKYQGKAGSRKGDSVQFSHDHGSIGPGPIQEQAGGSPGSSLPDQGAEGFREGCDCRCSQHGAHKKHTQQAGSSQVKQNQVQNGVEWSEGSHEIEGILGPAVYLAKIWKRIREGQVSGQPVMPVILGVNAPGRYGAAKRGAANQQGNQVIAIASQLGRPWFDAKGG